MKRYLDSGGNILVMLGEGGEKNYLTNVNFLLEEYGIMINTGKYELQTSLTGHCYEQLQLLCCSH
jgi:hypothetical protein